MTSLLLYAITLLWQPVTLNSDGSPCTDLAGYRVYERKPKSYYHRIYAPVVPKFRVRGLKPGRIYRYYVTAFDSSGNESAESNRVKVKR